MSGQFLFVVSSHGELGTSGTRTGSWLEEIAVPYWRFIDAGYQVTIASPKGGAAPLDPMSLDDPWISDTGRRFLSDEGAKASLAATMLLDDVDPAAYHGVYLVGGTATTWDFPHNGHIKRIVEAFYADSKVISAICHGVIGLVQAVDSNGEPLVKNRSITSISNAEDVMMGVDKIVPVLPEEMLRKLRAVYTAGPPFAEHVVCEPPFFTGQNPASADLLAVKVLGHLERTAEPSKQEA